MGEHVEIRAIEVESSVLHDYPASHNVEKSNEKVSTEALSVGNTSIIL